MGAGWGVRNGLAVEVVQWTKRTTQDLSGRRLALALEASLV